MLERLLSHVDAWLVLASLQQVDRDIREFVTRQLVRDRLGSAGRGRLGTA
jgi:hypothetical protein